MAVLALANTPLIILYNYCLHEYAECAGLYCRPQSIPTLKCEHLGQVLLSHLPARFPHSVLPAYSGKHLDTGLCSQQMLVIQWLYLLLFRRIRRTGERIEGRSWGRCYHRGTSLALKDSGGVLKLCTSSVPPERNNNANNKEETAVRCSLLNFFHDDQNSIYSLDCLCLSGCTKCVCLFVFTVLRLKMLTWTLTVYEMHSFALAWCAFIGFTIFIYFQFWMSTILLVLSKPFRWK